MTFEANLTWSITGIERVTYSTDAENTKLYSPGIGNYYILNQGELGSTRDATLTSNGNATIALNIEVSITAGENASNSELCDIAKSALNKKAHSNRLSRKRHQRNSRVSLYGVGPKLYSVKIAPNALRPTRHGASALTPHFTYANSPRKPNSSRRIGTLFFKSSSTCEYPGVFA